MESFTLELTFSEAEVLLKLIDLAVRGGGMNVAQASVVLSGKIQQAVKDSVERSKLNGGVPKKDGEERIPIQ